MISNSSEDNIPRNRLTVSPAHPHPRAEPNALAPVRRVVFPRRAGENISAYSSARKQRQPLTKYSDLSRASVTRNASYGKGTERVAHTPTVAIPPAMRVDPLCGVRPIGPSCYDIPLYLAGPGVVLAGFVVVTAVIAKTLDLVLSLFNCMGKWKHHMDGNESDGALATGLSRKMGCGL